MAAAFLEDWRHPALRTVPLLGLRVHHADGWFSDGAEAREVRKALYRPPFLAVPKPPAIVNPERSLCTVLQLVLVRPSSPSDSFDQGNSDKVGKTGGLPMLRARRALADLVVTVDPWCPLVTSKKGSKLRARLHRLRRSNGDSFLGPTTQSETTRRRQDRANTPGRGSAGCE